MLSSLHRVCRKRLRSLRRWQIELPTFFKEFSFSDSVRYGNGERISNSDRIRRRNPKKPIANSNRITSSEKTFCISLAKFGGKKKNKKKIKTPPEIWQFYMIFVTVSHRSKLRYVKCESGSYLILLPTAWRSLFAMALEEKQTVRLKRNSLISISIALFVLLHPPPRRQLPRLLY